MYVTLKDACVKISPQIMAAFFVSTKDTITTPFRTVARGTQWRCPMKNQP